MKDLAVALAIFFIVGIFIATVYAIHTAALP